ncbi:MAG TPA: phosphatidylserine decarboxylase [Candidatus Thermoplasmatota archaeon]|nr:phosphatidylserine decarboxylase [Candidatus Thermoplasmatota archaeon]
MHLARGAWGWILAPTMLAVAVLATAWRFSWDWLYWVAVPLVALAGFFAWFFRDPDRMVAQGLVSPADGRVTRLERLRDPDIGDAERICIFMSPIDVHVNRFPLSGTVARVTHHAGAHVPAFDKDSDANERVETLLSTAAGPVKVVQIAGTVARRIVPYIVRGQGAIKGARMGLIRFGSRCDVILPAGRAQWLVQPGDKVSAGSTQLAAIDGVDGAVASGAATSGTPGAAAASPRMEAA